MSFLSRVSLVSRLLFSECVATVGLKGKAWSSVQRFSVQGGEVKGFGFRECGGVELNV